MKRNLLLTLISVLAIVSLSCVSPFYGTARIEPGWHINTGLAGTSYIKGDNHLDPYYKGIRGDIEIGYGMSKYVQCNLRMSLGLGLDGKVYYYNPEPAEDVGNDLFYDVALKGLVCWPVKKIDVTPALGIEAGFGLGRFYACPLLLLGLGDPEFLTLGGRFYGYGMGDFFATVHISSFNIFLGINAWTLVNPDYRYIPPIATIGVGYKIK